MVTNKKAISDMTLREIIGILTNIADDARQSAREACKTENLDRICKLHSLSMRAAKELDKLYMLEQLIEHMRIQLEKIETRESAY